MEYGKKWKFLKNRIFHSSGDRVAQIKFSEESGSSDKMNLEGLSKKGQVPKNVHKLFCNAQAESVEFVTELSEESRLTMHVNAEVQTNEFDYMFRKEIYTPPNRDYFRSDDKVRFYTQLSFKVLNALLFIEPHVSRKTQTLYQF